jgi:ribosomal protein L11 methyltransferase
MFWRVFFHCDPAHASDLGSALEDHVSAVSWFETKDSNFWVVEAIATTEPNQEEFTNILSAACANLNTPAPSLIIEALPETDWLEATWRNFPPQQIGRYYVYGSHTDPKPPEGSVSLEINAATAFGSGEHETTTTCLLTLDDLAREGHIFQKPIDMGCGSGILGIAIAKTWNIPVIAADNDPESVRVATNNAVLNHCDGLFSAYLSEGFENPVLQAQGPYDLVVANILATPLIEMAPSLSHSLAPKGWVILSGLLSRHRADIVKAYEAEGLHLVSHRTLNDWEALLVRKG